MASEHDRSSKRKWCSLKHWSSLFLSYFVDKVLFFDVAICPVTNMDDDNDREKMVEAVSKMSQAF